MWLIIWFKDVLGGKCGILTLLNGKTVHSRNQNNRRIKHYKYHRLWYLQHRLYSSLIPSPLPSSGCINNRIKHRMQQQQLCVNSAYTQQNVGLSCALLRTVPYNLPLLFIATNSWLLTPNRLITPRSTVEISIRPEWDTMLERGRVSATLRFGTSWSGLCSSDGCNLAGALRLGWCSVLCAVISFMHVRHCGWFTACWEQHECPAEG